MNKKDQFLVTLKVELPDGSSREKRFRLHQDDITNLTLEQDIDNMYEELLEPVEF